MKKIILLVVLTIMGMSAYASDTSGKALTMRTALKSYLQSEGYAPSIDSDGDIAFKYQGSNYYIICENWNNMVYVNIFSLLDIEGALMSKVRKAADEAQKGWKFVRINVNAKSASIAITMPAQSASDVKPVLGQFLSIIANAKSDFKDNYNDE